MRSSTDARVITYGIGGDVRISDLHLDELARARFRIETPWGGGRVQLAVSGAHMAQNAAAAVAVAGVVEGSLDAALAALADATISGMRMEVTRAASGALVVNDAYNANPDSMRAALEALSKMTARRHVALLGEMAELDNPPAGHQQVMDDAIERGIEIVAVGTELYGIRPVDDPVAALGELGDGDIVLVKASRAAGLERWAEALLAP
jgi:UDP-N-acetylmuramoyl-tripeptide--D-alanyl-D-alanine ligase